MKLGTVLATALKGKVLALVLVSTAVVGGATVTMAATPVGRSIVQQVTQAKTTVTEQTNQSDHSQDHKATPNANKNQDNKDCAGLPDAQRLATKYSLSTAATGDDVMAICSLHDGTFKATTSSGTAVTASKVYGYGEIDELLTLAQFMAGHDKTNASAKLSDSNVSTFLADAIHSCGTTALEVCLNTNMSNTHGNNNNTGSGNKPTSTPTPNNNKPTSTPTPRQH